MVYSSVYHNHGEVNAADLCYCRLHWVVGFYLLHSGKIWQGLNLAGIKFGDFGENTVYLNLASFNLVIHLVHHLESAR